MAAGLPVVAPALGGPAEIIDDGVTGLLYPPGDADALAVILQKLQEDPHGRKRLGEAAQTRAGDYAPERVAPAMMRVYRQVLSRKK